MAFPTTVAPTVTLQGSNATSHVIDVPAHNAGDLLLLLFGADGFPPSQDMRVTSITALNGAAWTIINSGGTGGQGQTIATPSATFAWVRAASNQATATTVTAVTFRNEMSVSHVYRVQGAHATEGPAFQFGEGAGGTVPYDPPALNPAGWDVEDTLWLFFTTADSNTGTTTFDTTPSGWTLTTTTTVSDVKVLSGYRAEAVASQDPAGGDLNEAEQTISFTIGIRPAAGGPSAPTVTATATPSNVAVNDPITLDGTLISDGGDPSITYAWTHLSGPGVATFGDATALDTTVQCDTAGNHVFRLSATNSNGTGTDDTGTVSVGVTATITQAHFRVRSDGTQPANADAGWAVPLDTDASIDMEGAPDGVSAGWGIRFEIEETGGASTGSQVYKLQARYRPFGGSFGAWGDVRAENSVGEADTVTEEIAGWPVAGVSDGVATTDVLSGSAAPFVAGSVETGGAAATSMPTAAVTLASQHTELEWRLVIHHFSDGPTTVNVGDQFQLRAVLNDGTPLDSYLATPTITVGASIGIIGGTYPEAPNRVGPVEDGNGALYTICEYAVTQNQFVLLKSADGGDTWVEVGLTGKPSWNDVESGDLRKVGDVLHIAYQGFQQDNVVYGQFAMSSHPTNPDEWLVTETIDPSLNPLHQNATLEVRSDGTVFCGYAQLDGNSVEHEAFKIRSDSTPSGTWGSETIINPLDGNVYWHIVSVKEPSSDVIWIFYWSAGTIFYRTLSAADVLGPEQTLVSGLPTAAADRHPLLPPIAYTAGGDDIILCVFKAADDTLDAIQFTNGTPGAAEAVTAVAVEKGEGQSGQPAATLEVVGDTAHVFYADAATQDLWHTQRPHGGAWQAATEVIDGTGIDWVRTRAVTGGLGVYYDIGSDGGSGRGRYLLYPLSPAIRYLTVTRQVAAQVG